MTKKIMDRKISEYQLLWDEGYTSLGKQVKRALADGWELYGNPFTSQGVVGQAVVKYFEDEKTLPERHVNSFTFTILVGEYYKEMEKIHDMDGRGIVHRYSVNKDNPLKYTIDIEVYDEGYREFLEWAASNRNN